MKKAVPYILLIILFVGAAWYSLMKPTDPVDELPPPVIVPAASDTLDKPPPMPGDSGDLYPETGPAPVIPPEPLPQLNESDAEIRQALAGITGEEPLAQYLVMDQVISRVVASIDSLSSRQVPVHINPVMPAKGTFLVDEEGESIIMSERNFARYDGFVALLQNMDTGLMMTFYRRYVPLFQQAWEENGGLGSFEYRMLEVIDELLQAPDITGPVYLTKPEAVYLFEDPELEAMTAGQKVLVRMGRENAGEVKKKLEEIKEEIIRQRG